MNIKIPVISKYIEKRKLIKFKRTLYSNIIYRVNAEQKGEGNGELPFTIVPIALKLTPTQISLLKEVARLSTSLSSLDDKQKEESNDMLYKFVSNVVAREIDEAVKKLVFNVPQNYDELYILAKRIESVINTDEEKGNV